MAKPKPVWITIEQTDVYYPRYKGKNQHEGQGYRVIQWNKIVPFGELIRKGYVSKSSETVPRHIIDKFSKKHPNKAIHLNRKSLNDWMVKLPKGRR